MTSTCGIAVTTALDAIKGNAGNFSKQETKTAEGVATNVNILLAFIAAKSTKGRGRCHQYL